MWQLEAIVNNEVSFYWLIAGDIVVGRREADIIISGVQSVSRKHATILVSPFSSHQMLQINSRQNITIQDLSKFGTFVNGEKISPSRPFPLKDGDAICFSSNQSEAKLKIRYETLIFFPIDLSSSEIQELNDLSHKIGAIVVTEFSDAVTHAISNKLIVSSNLSQVLVCKKNILITNMDWVSELSTQTCRPKSLPSPTEFLPDDQIIQSDYGVNIFDSSLNRSDLFQGLNFIFFSYTLEQQCHKMISACSGKTVIWNFGDVNDSLIQKYGEMGSVIILSDPEKNELNDDKKKIIEKASQNSIQITKETFLFESIIACDIARIYSSIDNDVLTDTKFDEKSDSESTTSTTNIKNEDEEIQQNEITPTIEKKVVVAQPLIIDENGFALRRHATINNENSTQNKLSNPNQPNLNTQLSSNTIISSSHSRKKFKKVPIKKTLQSVSFFANENEKQRTSVSNNQNIDFNDANIQREVDISNEVLLNEAASTKGSVYNFRSDTESVKSIAFSSVAGKSTRKYSTRTQNKNDDIESKRSGGGLSSKGGGNFDFFDEGEHDDFKSVKSFSRSMIDEDDDEEEDLLQELQSVKRTKK